MNQDRDIQVGIDPWHVERSGLGRPKAIFRPMLAACNLLGHSPAMASKKKKKAAAKNDSRPGSSGAAKIIRFHEKDLGDINAAIERSGMGQSEWCRMILLAAAGNTDSADAIHRARQQALKAEEANQ
jgi:hypothetical protein